MARVRSQSIRVRADHLAAVDRAERLPNPDPGPWREDPYRLVASHSERHSRTGVERPGVDRVLDEADRAVDERDVDPAGVEARDTVDERAALVDGGQVRRLLLRIDRPIVGIGGVAEVARGPPVPVLEAAMGCIVILG